MKSFVLLLAVDIIMTNKYCLAEKIFQPFFTLSAAPIITSSKELCDENKQAELIENFFNIVFAEFINAQPACLCIQLCLGHSMFCYPNGCFQNIHNRTKDAEKLVTILVNSTEDEYTTRSFAHAFADESFEDFIADSMIEHISKDTNTVTSTNANPFRFNPFKDRFQLRTYLKYKQPKLSTDPYYESDDILTKKKIDTYKNTRIDITRTKWPMDTNEDPGVNANRNNDIYSKISKDANKGILTSTFDVEERINLFEGKTADATQISVLPTKNDIDYSKITKLDIHDLFFSDRNDIKNKTSNRNVQMVNQVSLKKEEQVANYQSNRNYPNSYHTNVLLNLTSHNNITKTGNSLQIGEKPKESLAHEYGKTSVHTVNDHKNDTHITQTIQNKSAIKKLPLFDYSKLKNQMSQRQKSRDERRNLNLSNSRYRNLRQKERSRALSHQVEFNAKERVQKIINNFQRKEKRENMKADNVIYLNENDLFNTTFHKTTTDNHEILETTETVLDTTTIVAEAFTTKSKLSRKKNLMKSKH